MIIQPFAFTHLYLYQDLLHKHNSNSRLEQKKTGITAGLFHYVIYCSDYFTSQKSLVVSLSFSLTAA